MPRLATIYDWGKIVQTLRSEHFLDLGQEELAREVGVCGATVSKWERGIVVPLRRHRRKLKELALAHGFAPEFWPTRHGANVTT